ncbi:large subunit ribosomal protein L21 [Xanthomonas sacchari]|nr:large subunit ribosomal protein L21 [Xanthomonas sp. F10]
MTLPRAAAYNPAPVCPKRHGGNDHNNYRGSLVMYAVLVTGGKQYRVAQGETLRVEKLEVEAGNEITFDNILMLGDSDGIKIGDALKGAAVTAKVVAHGRADKVRIIKFRRRKHHMKRQGHRQHYTEIEITGIAGGDKK